MKVLAGIGAVMAVAVMVSSAQAAPAHPDFTGLWATAAGPVNVAGIAGPPGANDGTPAYTDEYKQQLAANAQKIKDGHLDMGGMCSPPGMPRLVLESRRVEIVRGVSPATLLMLYETQSQVRRIQVDEKPLTEAVLDDPQVNGVSAAKWEGDTLVVDTWGVKDFTYLTRAALPHSSDTRSIERWTLKDKNTLELDMTITDASAFIAPWRVKRTFKRDQAEVVYNECNENPRHVTSADGRVLNVAPSN